MKYIFILFVFLVSCEEMQTSLIGNNEFIDDRDGRIYSTIDIGDQTWMTKNLEYAPYNNENYYHTDKYGVLYSYRSAASSCPKGWHLPTDEEWIQLIEYLINDPGDQLKNGEFEALFGGWYQGEYLSEGRIGAWWTATECFNRYAWVYYVNPSDDVLRTNLPKSCKLTIRCVKDIDNP